MTLEIEGVPPQDVPPRETVPENAAGGDARPPKVFRLPGVYRPQEDSMLLAREYLRSGLAGRGAVLDACCGTGYLALTAARSGCASVTAVDSSMRAVLSARMNAALLKARVDVVHSDLATLVGARSFDTILTNPPYVPWRASDSARPCPNWDAGANGRSVIDVLCLAANRLLRPGGSMLMVHSGISGVEETLSLLRGNGLVASVVARQGIPFGPVMRQRRNALVKAGYLSPSQVLEEIVVVRADKR